MCQKLLSLSIEMLRTVGFLRNNTRNRETFPEIKLNIRIKHVFDFREVYTCI